MSISRASATALLNSVQRGLSPIELVYVPHPKWPLPRSQSLVPQRPLQISVLDSSFNPPTLAHLALANAPRPRVGSDVGGEYDAKIYLLSVRNADKTLKPTDASYIQRLEMMLCLAQDSVSSRDEHQVAIGIVDEPTFVGKASKLLAFLAQRLSGLGFAPPRPELTFLLGLDTLERVLAPRYYGASPADPDAEAKMFASLHTFFSPEHDNARIVCARRASVSSSEAATLKIAERFVSEQRIALIDIGEAEQTYSSTAVRNAIGQGDDSSWKGLVSPSVREYITGSMLYTNPVD
ncbi:hypothetical protein MSAN_00060900 [Mycena sanguinolenta]|uniref:Nicotinamide-nucleotide adenylyltransferase n=1 Tax=Mycena sanguinolenta TaxID=230812 RepID=A0A8H7DL84_9AGAR|nr:hypothetical protein MSAN_00060900 [Mycena sanguinolenta]